MAISIAFANQKGGVGKTTFSTQLAFYLKLKKHKRVLLIDMDAQGNSTGTLLAGEELTSTNTQDLFNEDLEKVEVQTTPRGIDIIGTLATPEAYDVEALPLEKVMNPVKHLEPVFENYDYVIVDCPPTLGRRLTAALILTDFVVTPQKLSGYAVDGVVNLFNTIVEIQSGPNPKLQILGVIINEWRETAAQKETLRNIREVLGDYMLTHKIRNRAPYDVAAQGVPVWETRGGQRASEEIFALFDEMIKRAAKLSAPEKAEASGKAAKSEKTGTAKSTKSSRTAKASKTSKTSKASKSLKAAGESEGAKEGKDSKEG